MVFELLQTIKKIRRTLLTRRAFFQKDELKRKIYNFTCSGDGSVNRYTCF
jgi:hypothetical protein